MAGAQQLENYHHISLRRATLAMHQIDDRLHSIRHAEQKELRLSFNLDPDFYGFDGGAALLDRVVALNVKQTSLLRLPGVCVHISRQLNHNAI